MICKHCNKQIENDSKFCIFCGAEQIEKIKYKRGNLESFKQGDKWGLKDIDTRDVIVQAKYTYIGLFVNDKAIVKGNNKFGFIDKNGIQITQLKYDSVQEFKNSFAIIECAGKFSFINENGAEIAPFKYDKVYEYANGFARVICDGRYSFINQDGIEITPFHYSYVKNFNNGFAKVRKDNCWGIINEFGKEILPCEYYTIKDYIDGIALIQNFKGRGRWGVVDEEGTILIPVKFIFKQIKILDNGEIAVKEGQNWKCYNKEGKINSEPSKVFNVFRKNKKRKKRTIRWLIIAIVLIIIILAINKKYPNGVYVKGAKEKLEELEYMELRKTYYDGTSESFKNYLKNYPNGRYSEEAKENYEWKNAERINTVASYSYYLDKYPKGEYSKKANIILTDSNSFFKDGTLYKHQCLYVVAKVISNSTNKRKNYLMLNKGNIHGIRRDMGVITSTGIVGTVIDISKNFSIVISVLHINNKINARIKKNRHLGSIEWDGSDYRKGLLTDIPIHVRLYMGDTIITSGNSHIFPEGIIIGTVEEYFSKQGDKFNKARINFAVDYNKLYYVYIIKNL